MTPNAEFYVIGHPIAHSMSPFIHERLFKIKGLDAGYSACDITPDKLTNELPPLLHKAGGLNVTIPHKQTVIPLLDELRGRAQVYRSVNTISKENNRFYGHNTDAKGFLSALELGGIKLNGRVAILGCGGVGRTFACEAALAGCSVVNAVRLADLEHAEQLRDFVLDLSPSTRYTVTTLDQLDCDINLMINATPVGMYPNIYDMPVSPKAVHRAQAVFDAVYNPVQTSLLKCSEANGARALGGMSMLVWQAVAAQEIWFGSPFEPDEIAQLIEDASAQMCRSFG